MEFHAPTSLDEALDLRARLGSAARPLAGGTDLFVELNARRIQPKALLYLGRLGGLREIRREDGYLAIGSLVTYRELADSPEIRELAPALAQAAVEVGGPAVQNMGTIGGNVVTGSPAADGVCALLALGARARLRSACGPRIVDLAEFFTGPKRTVLRDEELLVEVQLPTGRARLASGFVKLGKRRANAISVVMVSAGLELDEAGTCQLARIGIGAAAPTPLRAREAEARLVGQAITPETIAEAARTAAEEIRPISDVRGEAWYRRAVAGVLVRRAIERAMDGRPTTDDRRRMMSDRWPPVDE